MPTTNFTDKELRDHFDGYRPVIFKDQIKKLSLAMKVHAEGVYPTLLIEERRPNETVEVKEYRKTIWKPVTKPVFSRILTSLQKIRRSSDWAVLYKMQEMDRVVNGETLYDYCESKYPNFESLTNWAFSILLKSILIDPNSVVFIKPLNISVEATEYLRPACNIVAGTEILQYVEGDYLIFKDTDKYIYNDSSKQIEEDKFYVVTTLDIIVYTKTQKGDYIKREEYRHNLGVLPVVPLKGIPIQTKNGRTLYESRVEAIVPELDEAVREYSDLQAGVVLNMFPERWEYTTNECDICRGTGKISKPDKTYSCEKCNGRGYVASSPFSKMLVTKPEAGESAPPTPPAGYITKDTEMIKLQDERFHHHIYKALCSINMQFLEQTPLNVSGQAKEVDRDELNNFVACVAEDIVSVLDTVYYIIAKYRYGLLITDEEVLKSYLPIINVPTKFDILSSKHIEEEIRSAKEGKLNPLIVGRMELDYVGKKYFGNDDVRMLLTNVIELDPFANISQEEKSLMLQNRGITKEDYILSCNIQQIVLKAFTADSNFFSYDYIKRKEIVEQLSAEIVAKQNEAEEMMRELLPPSGTEEEEDVEEGEEGEGDDE